MPGHFGLGGQERLPGGGDTSTGTEVTRNSCQACPAPFAGEKRERQRGQPGQTDPNSLFSMVYFYTLRCYAKVTWGQQS